MVWSVQIDEKRIYVHQEFIEAPTLEEAVAIANALARSDEYIEDTAGSGEYYDTAYEVGLVLETKDVDEVDVTLSKGDVERYTEG